MISFPIQDLMDDQKCYDYLLKVLYPQSLTCPAVGWVARQAGRFIDTVQSDLV